MEAGCHVLRIIFGLYRDRCDFNLGQKLNQNIYTLTCIWHTFHYSCYHIHISRVTILYSCFTIPPIDFHFMIHGSIFTIHGSLFTFQITLSNHDSVIRFTIPGSLLSLISLVTVHLHCISMWMIISRFTVH